MSVPASNFSQRANTWMSQKWPAVSHVYATSSGTPRLTASFSTSQQGLTLLHFSAQLERFLWEIGVRVGVVV